MLARLLVQLFLPRFQAGLAPFTEHAVTVIMVYMVCGTKYVAP